MVYVCMHMFICIHMCAHMHVDAVVNWPHSSCLLTDMILCTYSLWYLEFCLDNYLKLSKINNWLWSLEIGFLLFPPLYANLLSEPWTFTNAWLCLIFNVCSCYQLTLWGSFPLVIYLISAASFSAFNYTTPSKN